MCTHVPGVCESARVCVHGCVYVRVLNRYCMWSLVYLCTRQACVHMYLVCESACVCVTIAVRAIMPVWLGECVVR